MVSRMTLLSHALLAWGGVVGLGALSLPDARFSVPLAIVGIAAGTGGLVVGVIGAARHDGL